MSELSMQPDEIEQALRLVMESCPVEERLNACESLAMHLLHCGQFAQALPYFEMIAAVLTNKAAQAQATYNMGVCLMQTGYLDGARECFEKAANLNPDSAARPHLKLSSLFRMADNMDAARAHAGLAVEKAQAANDCETLMQAETNMSILIRMFPAPKWIM